MNDYQFEHILDDSFTDLEAELSEEIRKRVAKQFRILQNDPLYPSLQFKKVKTKRGNKDTDGSWSLRINKNYRALGFEIEGVITWYWVGPHREYEKMLK